MLRTFVIFLALGAVAADIGPTFLYRNLHKAEAVPSELSTPTCVYKPLFGSTAKAADVGSGVTRFGVLAKEPKGQSGQGQFAEEEQIVYVLEGKGQVVYRGVRNPIRKGDFMYFAPGTAYHIENHTDSPLTGLLMGFQVDRHKSYPQPMKLPLANESEARQQVVGNHPPSTLYRLLLGDTQSQRDLLAVGHRVSSLFIMDFAAGGTNFPHHHLREEEIYLILEGEGDMVAGGGTDGNEGLRPAKAGDAYYFRPNATVGFYNRTPSGQKSAKILAVRSRFPALD